MIRLVRGLERSFDRSQNLGPKCKNLWNPFGQSVTVHRLFGLLVYNLSYKLYCGVYGAGNDYGIRVHKVKPMLGDWS